jgi:hypothetical protein
MLGRHVSPVSIIYFYHMQRFIGLRVEKNNRNLELRDDLPKPNTITANFGYCPNNPLHLARDQTVYDLFDILVFCLM